MLFKTKYYFSIVERRVGEHGKQTFQRFVCLLYLDSSKARPKAGSEALLRAIWNVAICDITSCFEVQFPARQMKRISHFCKMKI